MHTCQVIGEDACPGLKQNGFPYLIRRTVDCLCPGDAIPASIEVDISGLQLGQTVLLPHLKLPTDVKLVALVLLWLCLFYCECLNFAHCNLDSDAACINQQICILQPDAYAACGGIQTTRHSRQVKCVWVQSCVARMHYAAQPDA